MSEPPQNISDTGRGEEKDYQLDFPNINNLEYYKNSRGLEKIKAYEDKEQWNKLVDVLHGYVNNFGIKNFARDTKLIWKLGQLHYRLGHKQRAKEVFRLVLKHHSGDIDKVRRFYDSLTHNKAEDYVSIDYYYELVEHRRQVDTLAPPENVKLNMGEQVNDEGAPDYAPTLDAEKNKLVFTKKKYIPEASAFEQRFDEDLYYSRNFDGYWGEAKQLPPPVNSPCNEGSAFFSRDGKTLYFSRCSGKAEYPACSNSYGSCDIYVTRFNEKDSTWSRPENLGANVNSTAWDSHPTLSHSGDTLYFASNRLSGFGLSDIYYTCRKEDSTWAPAKNAGPYVNTRKNEVSPFYHRAHNVLYFSSNGHLVNFGSYDIFKAYRQPGGQWGDPKNIGPLVNGNGKEYYFTIGHKSEDLFYAKSPRSNMDDLDLYSFPVPMGAKPTATTKIKGEVINNKTGEPVEGIVSVIDLENGVEVAPKRVRDDGTYEFNLINDNDYLLVVQGDDFFRYEKEFHLDGDTSMVNKPRNLKLKFESIEFNGGSAEILPKMKKDLNDIMNFLIDHPSHKLKISGHTDSDGNQEYNLKLSQRRADAIKEYLMERGKIDSERISAKGYGSSRPIIDKDTEKAKQVNRRVEFEIIRPEGSKKRARKGYFDNEKTIDN